MAIELIDKIKQKNNGSFYLVDAIDVEYSGGGSVDAAIKKILNNPSSGGSGEGGSCTVYAGTEEPLGIYEVWIDTNDTVTEVENEPNNPILEEFRAIFLTLQNRIAELEEDNIFLKAEIEALKLGLIPPNDDTSSIKGALLLPNGSPLLLPNGSPLLLGSKAIEDDIAIKDALLLDNGSPLMLEENNYLLYKKE